MEQVIERRPLKLGKCGICGAGCRSDWIETDNGVEFVSPRCAMHKPNAKERQREHVRKYEKTHGVNNRVYSFTDKEGNVVVCKKAWWYRARKDGRFAEGQASA